jgi:hypothetical protein
MLPVILAHGGASDFQLSASMKSGIEIHKVQNEPGYEKNATP